MNLIIDIGNTVAKLALFEGHELIEIHYDSNQSLDSLQQLCRRNPIKKGIISSVVQISGKIEKQLEETDIELMRLDSRTPLPIQVLYQTPETLGSDRIAAVVGAWQQKPGCNLLVIDAGTCITYEFIDAQGNYRGGNISPGKTMRLQALHHFTDKLPLVKAEGDVPDMGYDTETAIRAGVIKGMEAEMSGYIVGLQKKYPELFVFLTGGDDFSFDTNLKSSIFADRFLVLKGLNRILEYNDNI